jgi:hypothetical protein
MTDVAFKWHGAVHEFHSPTAVTASNGDVTVGCGNIENGRTCGQPEASAVHRFVASSSCNYPVATVQIYVQRGTGYVGKIHWATFGWQAENDGSWFSGWYQAHNQPNVWRRMERLDCKSGPQIGQLVGSACSGAYTESILTDMEVHNQ